MQGTILITRQRLPYVLENQSFKKENKPAGRFFLTGRVFQAKPE